MGIAALVITETDVVATQKIFASTEIARNAQLTTWANDEVVAKAVDLSTPQNIAAKKTFDGGIDLSAELITNVKDPVSDQDATTKKWVEDTFGEYPINGTPTAVFTKFLTGTLDSDASTTVAHGITTGATKILALNVSVFNNGNGKWQSRGVAGDNFAANGYSAGWDDTNIEFINVGTNIQGQAYRVKIDYIL